MTKTNEEIYDEYDIDENQPFDKSLILKLMQKAREEVINKIDSVCDSIREYSCRIAKEGESQALRTSGFQNACASIEEELRELKSAGKGTEVEKRSIDETSTGKVEGSQQPAPRHIITIFKTPQGEDIFCDGKIIKAESFFGKQNKIYQDYYNMNPEWIALLKKGEK